MNPRLLRFALTCGVAVPGLYFGAQILAAPWYPGFDALRDGASDLGSPLSRCPMIFNATALVCGACGLVAAPALGLALQARGLGRWLPWLFSLATASAGFGALWAGWHPMPHPLHAEPWPGVGLFFLPLLTAVLVWRGLWKNQRVLRLYAWVNLAAFLLLVPLLSPLGEGFLHGARGLVQRLAAATAFVPVGIVAWSLNRKQEISPPSTTMIPI